MPVIGVSNAVMLKTMSTLGWQVIRAGGNISRARERPLDLRDQDDDRITVPMSRDIIRLGDLLDTIQMNEQAGPYIVNVTVTITLWIRTRSATRILVSRWRSTASTVDADAGCRSGGSSVRSKAKPPRVRAFGGSSTSALRGLGGNPLGTDEASSY